MTLVALCLPLHVLAGTYGDGAYGGGNYGIGGSPAISSISAGTPGQTNATITWTTDEAADSQVAYGTTSAYRATTTLDSTLVTSHSVDLSSLSANTTYHFQIITTDGSSSVATSSDQTFATAAASSGGGGGGGGGGPIAGSLSSSSLVNTNAIPPATSATTSSSTAAAATSTTQGPGPASPSSFAFTFIRSLQIGSKGEDVRELQIYLNGLGFPVSMSGVGSPGQETDYFGRATQAALVKFQLANGITTDTGYFGPRTRALIASLALAGNAGPAQNQAATSPGFQFTRNLSFGSVDDQVTALQKFLNSQGFTIANTGPGSPRNEIDAFGSKTKAALIRFQQAHADVILMPLGLTEATGFFGTTTRNYMNGL